MAILSSQFGGKLCLFGKEQVTSVQGNSVTQYSVRYLFYSALAAVYNITDGAANNLLCYMLAPYADYQACSHDFGTTAVVRRLPFPIFYQGNYE